MAKFKVTFNNSAGELGHRVVESEADGEDGLPFCKFMFAFNEMLDAVPLHDGDSFTVELEDE
jgi:hypothetical protein